MGFDRISRVSPCANRNSDGTVVFSLAPMLTGGSKKTANLCDKQGKPWIHLPGGEHEPASRLLACIAENGIGTLNVAGALASKEPEIYLFVSGRWKKFSLRESRVCLGGPNDA